MKAAWVTDGSFVPGACAAAGEAVPVRASVFKTWVARIALVGTVLFFVAMVVDGLSNARADQALASLFFAAVLAWVLFTTERQHARDRSRGYLLRVDERGIHLADAPPVPWGSLRALELRSVRGSIVTRPRPHLVLHVDAAVVEAVGAALRTSPFGGEIGRVDHAASCILFDVSSLQYPPRRVAGIVRAAWERHGDGEGAAVPAASEAAHG